MAVFYTSNVNHVSRATRATARAPVQVQGAGRTLCISHCKLTLYVIRVSLPQSKLTLLVKLVCVSITITAAITISLVSVSGLVRHPL